MSNCDRRESSRCKGETQGPAPQSQRAPGQGSVTLSKEKEKHANPYERDLGRNNIQCTEEEKINPVQ